MATSPNTIFKEIAKDTVLLRDDKLYDIGGKVYSLRELQQAVIDQSLYIDLKTAIKGGK